MIEMENIKLKFILGLILNSIIIILMDYMKRLGFNTPFIIYLLFFLIYGQLAKKDSFVEVRKNHKIFYMILYKILCLISFFCLLIVIRYELPYIYNSFKIKNDIYKEEKIITKDKEINSKLLEEIRKKLTVKEIFLGNITFASSIFKNKKIIVEKEKHLIKLNEKSKIEIIEDNLDNVYLKITDRYYKKLDVELDF